MRGFTFQGLLVPSEGRLGLDGQVLSLPIPQREGGLLLAVQSQEEAGAASEFTTSHPAMVATPCLVFSSNNCRGVYNGCNTFVTLAVAMAVGIGAGHAFT